MRALTTLLVVTLVFAMPACKRHKAPQAAVQDGPPDLAAGVHMGDPKIADQLVAGFYDIEAQAWRWTAKDFSVVLRPPTGSVTAGASLQVTLTVPQVVIDKSTKVTLTPSIRGNQLRAETYTKAGDYVYQCDVPGNLLEGPSVRLDFQLDKAIPPSSTDLRQLGIVVSAMKLTLK